MEITITLTESEQKCLATITTDVNKWITNAATNRARIAKENIIASLVSHCNANSIQLETGEDNQINQAFDLGLVADLSTLPVELPVVSGDSA